VEKTSTKKHWFFLSDFLNEIPHLWLQFSGDAGHPGRELLLSSG